MKLTNYPEVIVEGAPGFGTFQGWLVWEGDAPAGRRSVVCALWEDKIETYMFDSKYVTSL